MIQRSVLKLLIASIFASYGTEGQPMIQNWKLELSAFPTAFSTDSEFNIFLGFENGVLQKLSKNGLNVESFSIPNQSSLTFIEAQNNRKIFLFYRDIQQILILDRFATIPKKYDTRSFGIVYAQAAGISPDGTFWLSENNPQRLKKIDPLRNTVIHEVQHTLGDSISMIRTYRNLLIISDENGLQILDQFGNLNGSIKLKGISYFHITNNKVHLTYPKGLITIDPFQIKVLEESQEEPLAGNRTIVKFNSEFVVVKDQYIASYSLTKQKK